MRNPSLIALQQSCHAPARPAHPRRPVRIRPHSVVSQPRFPTRQPPLCGVGMAATAACTRVHPGGVSWQELRPASHYFPQPPQPAGPRQWWPSRRRQRNMHVLRSHFTMNCKHTGKEDGGSDPEVLLTASEARRVSVGNRLDRGDKLPPAFTRSCFIPVQAIT